MTRNWKTCTLLAGIQIDLASIESWMEVGKK
jgi:hypothetical protein